MPEINSRACLWVLLRPRHLANWWLTIQRFIFLLMFCLETPEDGSGPATFRTEPSLGSLSAISFPRTPACPGTQYSPTLCRVEMLNDLWHSCSNERIYYAQVRCSFECPIIAVDGCSGFFYMRASLPRTTYRIPSAPGT